MSLDRGSYYVSAQDAYIYREIVDDNGRILSSTRVDPIGGDHPIGSLGYLFIDPFALDPNNTDQMYLTTGNYLWHNSDLTMIPLGSDDSSTLNWTKLTKTRLPSNSPYGQYSAISALVVSTIPADRVYYGTNDGQVFRLDSADISTSIPKNISKSKGFPAKAFVGCIAVDDENADNVLAVFSNYNIQSLFYTSDGGATWSAIGGNLEENSDGTGNGPSCRWASILHVGTGLVYLVGTSTGLYSTYELKGASTIWSLEGETTIGNNIVNMMDTRKSDGMVAVATCGNGVFTGQFSPIINVVHPADFLSLMLISPNPTTSLVTIWNAPLNLASISILNVVGQVVMEILKPSATELEIDLSPLPAGMYYARFVSPNSVEVRKIIKE